MAILQNSVTLGKRWKEDAVGVGLVIPEWNANDAEVAREVRNFCLQLGKSCTKIHEKKREKLSSGLRKSTIVAC